MHDLNLLVSLDALLDTRSVTGAADRLHLSPPAMSRALGRLRTVLDDPVLVRAGRGLVPTPQALALQSRVRAVVAEARDLLRPADQVEPANLERTFTIRGSEDVPAILGPVLLATVAAEAPAVTLCFAPEGDEDLDDLRVGRVDLDIGAQADPPPDIVVEDLVAAGWVGVVARPHPLTRGRVTPERFVAHGHVSASRRGLARGPVDGPLAELGLRRRIVAVVPSPSSALRLLEGTDLVAVLPAISVPADGPWTTFPLPVATPATTLSMAWHRRLDAEAGHAWLRGVVRDAFHAAR